MMLEHVLDSILVVKTKGYFGLNGLMHIYITETPGVPLGHGLIFSEDLLILDVYNLEGHGPVAKGSDIMFIYLEEMCYAMLRGDRFLDFKVLCGVNCCDLEIAADKYQIINMQDTVGVTCEWLYSFWNIVNVLFCRYRLINV
jgi:hypothetical protein